MKFDITRRNTKGRAGCATGDQRWRAMSTYVQLSVLLERKVGHERAVLIVAGYGNGLRCMRQAQRQLLRPRRDAGDGLELGLELRERP